jgi:hypothetical protein
MCLPRSPLFSQPPEVLIARAGCALEAFHQQLDLLELYLANIRDHLIRQKLKSVETERPADLSSLMDTAEDLPPPLRVKDGEDDDDSINWAAMDSWLDLYENN